MITYYVLLVLLSGSWGFAASNILEAAVGGLVIGAVLSLTVRTWMFNNLT